MTIVMAPSCTSRVPWGDDSSVFAVMEAFALPFLPHRPLPHGMRLQYHLNNHSLVLGRLPLMLSGSEVVHNLKCALEIAA